MNSFLEKKYLLNFATILLILDTPMPRISVDIVLCSFSTAMIWPTMVEGKQLEFAVCVLSWKASLDSAV